MNAEWGGVDGQWMVMDVKPDNMGGRVDFVARNEVEHEHEREFMGRNKVEE